MKRLLSTKLYDIDHIDGVIESYRNAIERDGFESVEAFKRCFDRLKDKPGIRKYRVNIEVIDITDDEY